MNFLEVFPFLRREYGLMPHEQILRGRPSLFSSRLVEPYNGGIVSFSDEF